MFDELHDPDPPRGDSHQFAAVTEKAQAIRGKRRKVAGAIGTVALVAGGAASFVALTDDGERQILGPATDPVVSTTTPDEPLATDPGSVANMAAPGVTVSPEVVELLALPACESDEGLADWTAQQLDWWRSLDPSVAEPAEFSSVTAEVAVDTGATSATCSAAIALDGALTWGLGDGSGNWVARATGVPGAGDYEWPAVERVRDGDDGTGGQFGTGQYFNDFNVRTTDLEAVASGALSPARNGSPAPIYVVEFATEIGLDSDPSRLWYLRTTTPTLDENFSGPPDPALVPSLVPEGFGRCTVQYGRTNTQGLGALAVDYCNTTSTVTVTTDKIVDGEPIDIDGINMFIQRDNNGMVTVGFDIDGPVVIGPATVPDNELAAMLASIPAVEARNVSPDDSSDSLQVMNADGETVDSCRDVVFGLPVEIGETPLTVRSGLTSSGGTWVSIDDAMNRRLFSSCQESEPLLDGSVEAQLAWPDGDDVYLAVIAPSAIDEELPSWFTSVSRSTLSPLRSVAYVARITPDIEFAAVPDVQSEAAERERQLIGKVEQVRDLRNYVSSIGVVATGSPEVLVPSFALELGRPELRTDALEHLIDHISEMDRYLVLRGAGECMEAQGFDAEYATGEPPPLSSPGRDLRYGANDLDHAIQWGYGNDPAELVNPNQYPDPGLAGQTDSIYAEAFLGDPDDFLVDTVELETGTIGLQSFAGCVGAASTAIHGDRLSEIEMQKAEAVAGDISNRSFLAMLEDSEVVAAAEAWSDCMQAAGYEIPGPWSIGDEHRADDIQHEVAEIDVTCKIETDFVAIGVAAEARWQEEHSDELDASTVELAAIYTDLADQYE